jgi:hypothetical protein
MYTMSQATQDRTLERGSVQTRVMKARGRQEGIDSHTAILMFPAGLTLNACTHSSLLLALQVRIKHHYA